MLKKDNVRDGKILKKIVGLQSIYLHINVTLVFYVKYNVNIFSKNIAWNVKNKKKNAEIVKNYSQNTVQIILSFGVFL